MWRRVEHQETFHRYVEDITGIELVVGSEKNPLAVQISTRHCPVSTLGHLLKSAWGPLLNYLQFFCMPWKTLALEPNTIFQYQSHQCLNHISAAAQESLLALQDHVHSPCQDITLGTQIYRLTTKVFLYSIFFLELLPSKTQHSSLFREV